jgi:hypothetical protein
MKYDKVVGDNIKLMLSRNEGGMLLQLERASLGRVGEDLIAHVKLMFYYDLVDGSIKVFGVKGSVARLDSIGYMQNGFLIDYHIGSHEKIITGYVHDNFPPKVKKVMDTCKNAWNGSDMRFA